MMVCEFCSPSSGNDEAMNKGYASIETSDETNFTHSEKQTLFVNAAMKHEDRTTNPPWLICLQLSVR
jgi:hypothetical protein